MRRSPNVVKDPVQSSKMDGAQAVIAILGILFPPHLSPAAIAILGILFPPPAPPSQPSGQQDNASNLDPAVNQSNDGSSETGDKQDVASSWNLAANQGAEVDFKQYRFARN
jgi:hypothetical protein